MSLTLSMEYLFVRIVMTWPTSIVEFSLTIECLKKLSISKQATQTGQSKFESIVLKDAPLGFYSFALLA